MDVNRQSHEIDIVGSIKKVLEEKKLLAVVLGVSAVLGVCIALSTQKSYTTSVVLAPEVSASGTMSESLSDMASSFGIDLNTKGSMDAIYPEIYPDIFASNDFIISLFDVKVTTKEEGKTKTYYEHLKSDGKVPFWSYPGIFIRNFLKKKEAGKGGKINPFMLSEDDEGICNGVRNSIGCLVDKKTNVITISMTDMDPMVAAIMADTLQSRLQSYITEYKTKKVRNDLKYYEKLYAESKADYVKAQRLYASFSDADQDAVLQTFQSKRDELENEMQLKYNIYNGIVAKLQNAKAKVQEQTPAFTIIQRPTVPNRASSTPRSVMVIMTMIFGFIADSLWVLFIRDFVKNRKTNNA